MDAIDKAYHAESRFIAQCSDIDVLIDRVADYREDARVAAQRGVTKARLRMADLLELAEDRITELKVLALNKVREEADRARQQVVERERAQRAVEREHAEQQAREHAAHQVAEREREATARQRQIAAERAASEAQALRAQRAEIERLAEERRAELKQEERNAAIERAAKGQRTSVAGPAPEQGQPAMTARMGASGAVTSHPPTPSYPKVPVPSVNAGAGTTGSGVTNPQKIAVAQAAAQGQGARAAPPGRTLEAPTRPAPPVLPKCATPPVKASTDTGTDVIEGAPRTQTLPPVASSGHSAQKPAAIPSSAGPIYAGSDLVRYRTEQGLTQRQAAERLGVAHGTIAKAEMDLARPLGEALQAGMRNARLR